MELWLLSSSHSPSFCLPQGEGEGEEELGEETQEEESGLLTIRDVTRAHAGHYRCTANNGIAPPASVDVQLVVHCEYSTVAVLRASGCKILMEKIWTKAHMGRCLCVTINYICIYLIHSCVCECLYCMRTCTCLFVYLSMHTHVLPV